MAENSKATPWRWERVGCKIMCGGKIIARVNSAWLDEDELNARAQLFISAPAMRAALEHAEAVLSIVEPRSDKAEYLECLTEIRAGLQAAGESDA